MATRRPRKTPRSVDDLTDLLNALKAIKIPPDAAHGMPFRSSSRYVQKFDDQMPDIKIVFDENLLH